MELINYMCLIIKESSGKSLPLSIALSVRTVVVFKFQPAIGRIFPQERCIGSMKIAIGKVFKGDCEPLI
jgi:hypothetical protein